MNLQTSQTQPEPNSVSAASTNFSLKFVNEPKSFSICWRTPSLGMSPPPGCMLSQKKSWFQTCKSRFISAFFSLYIFLHSFSYFFFFSFGGRRLSRVDFIIKFSYPYIYIYGYIYIYICTHTQGHSQCTNLPLFQGIWEVMLDNLSALPPIYWSGWFPRYIYIYTQT